MNKNINQYKDNKRHGLHVYKSQYNINIMLFNKGRICYHYIKENNNNNYKTIMYYKKNYTIEIYNNSYTDFKGNYYHKGNVILINSAIYQERYKHVNNFNRIQFNI